MTEKSRKKQQLEQLQSENQQLAAENRRLKATSAPARQAVSNRRGTGYARRALIFFLMLLAALLLFAGNIFFWTGNTVVKTDRYVEATAPLIRSPEIQTAISTYTTAQLFKSVDVEQFIEQALPPRAVFLAPTLSTQVEQHTDEAIMKLLGSPEFQGKWNTAQANAHSRFISTIKQHGSNGSIDLGEFYTQISQGLKGTKLAFLADKPLPAKIGSIKLVEGSWVSGLEKIINNIDAWRTTALILLLLLSVLAVWISRNRRSAVVRLGILFASTMFITLIAIRIAKVVITGKVDPQYSAAAGEAAGTILNPLVVQTRTILVLGLLIAFAAWIGGPSRNAAWLVSKIRLLFGGKLHKAIFHRENSFTTFVGVHKRALEWLVIVVALVSLLFIRLTPGALFTGSLAVLLLVLVIEAIGAPEATRPEPRSAR